MNDESPEPTDSRAMFDGVARGEEEAAEALFEAYCNRLVGLARKRLSEKLQRRVDAEDVVQSVFRSFFQRAQQGKYRIERGGDLWRLLASITRNKVLKKAEHHSQQRRAMDREEALASSADLGRFASAEPSEEDAIVLTDELQAVMDGLDETRRRVLELRLQGVSLPEIAAELERSERTIRRYTSELREALESRLLADADE